jgi:hypothetical protein
MKYICIVLILSLTVSCCSVKVNSSDTDPSLIFQQNSKGEIWLSSLNSAHQVEITKHRMDNDTLIIEYKRGVLCSKEKNLLPLNESTQFLKCANRLYKVEKNEKGFQINELN